ncbi:MAG: aspartate ammonia-lyase [Candidatus Micrarchaeota archaeon]
MRREKDFIGEVEVEEDAYYGAFTSRAKKNFSLSRIRVHDEMIRAIATIKRSAALANKELGRLEGDAADAIVKAADEVLSGKHGKQFVLDAFQAGAGTPVHMNVNEVLANRAEEILGGKKGEYKSVHPNNHVNMSQSSNNVIPTAVRLSCLFLLPGLLDEAKKLSASFRKLAKRNKDVLKCGRTHLMDAVPISYGQVFSAWAHAIDKDISSIGRASMGLLEIGIGGTATGTGITAHPDFRKKVVKQIAAHTKLKLRVADDPIELTENMNDFMLFSAALRQYGVTLVRIANDLRLLSSGPKTGIAEIILPAVEPGSSIMPGKVNPSIPEAVNMLGYQVIANDHAVMLAAQSGQLELNFCTPLIAHNLLQSMDLLTNGSLMFRVECVDGLNVDEKRVKELFERSFAYGTALNPYLGYSLVSKLVTEAYGKGLPLKDLILEKKILDKDELETILSAENTTGPAHVDAKLAKKIKERL